jgi:hypothetical protein
MSARKSRNQYTRYHKLENISKPQYRARERIATHLKNPDEEPASSAAQANSQPRLNSELTLKLSPFLDLKPNLSKMDPVKLR